MTRFEDKKQLRCSFCGKNQEQVKRLIAGPGVYICDECIDLCQEIIEEDDNGAVTLKFEVCGLIELKTWLLQWGDQVEVLEPESLRKDLLKEGLKIVNIYRKKGSRKRLSF